MTHRFIQNSRANSPNSGIEHWQYRIQHSALNTIKGDFKMVTALQAFRFSAGRQQLRYFPALLEKKPFPSLLALSPLSTTLQHEQVNRRFATKAVTEPSKTVYVNDRNTHIRILSLYLTGQSTYWTVLVAENYFTPLEDASESLSMFTSVVVSFTQGFIQITQAS